MRADHSAEDKFAALSGGRSFGGNVVAMPIAPTLRDGDIHLGNTAANIPVGISLTMLLKGRLLIQGNSGAGKSMLLRRLFEQAFGRVQQLLLDSDGEFSTLAEQFDVAALGIAEVLRVGARAFALHLREHRYSAVLDLSDATGEQRFDLVADLVSGLIEAAEPHWHPLLLLVDEAQTFAPRYDTGDVETTTRKRTITALADMMGRGRKRGIAGIIATQRLAETATPVVSKATNIIAGRTVFDRDLERAGALLGFTVGQSRPLRTLADGEFLCLGPALAGSKRMRFRTGPVKSRHKGSAPDVAAPPAIGAAVALSMLRELPATAAVAAEVVSGASSGSRRLFWKPEWDAIVRAGYSAGKSLKAIIAELFVAGLSVTPPTLSSRAHQLGLVSEHVARQWCDAEDQILRDAHAREVRMIDIVGLLEEAGFKRGRVAVQMRAITLGITRDRVNYWTEPEKQIALSGLASGKTNREIIAELKAAGYERGVTSISKLAQKHNFDRSHQPWSDADLAKLQELYQTTPVAKLIEIFGKPRSAIAAMASKLGLRQRAPWTEAEKAILVKAHRNGKRLIDIPALLPGRTYATVARMAGQMRLDFSAGRSKKTQRRR